MKALFLCFFYFFLVFSFTKSNSLLIEENLLKSKNFLFLPKHVTPVEYNLHIKTYLPSDDVSIDQRDLFKFAGNLSILIRCGLETNFVTLHSKNLNFFRTSLRIFEVDFTSRMPSIEVDVDIDNVQEFESLEQIRIPLRTSLKQGKYYAISLNYEGNFNHRPFGFYKSSYNEKNKIKYILSTMIPI